jgi:hypothetical protein
MIKCLNCLFYDIVKDICKDDIKQSGKCNFVLMTDRAYSKREIKEKEISYDKNRKGRE